MIHIKLEQNALGPAGARLLITSGDSVTHRLAKPRIGFSKSGALDGDYFEFEPTALYLGEQREDADTLYEAGDYVTTHPGVILVSLVNLLDHYDLPARGTGRVRYNALHNLDGEPVYLSSPWVVFDFARGRV